MAKYGSGSIGKKSPGVYIPRGLVVGNGMARGGHRSEADLLRCLDIKKTSSVNTTRKKTIILDDLRRDALSVFGHQQN